MADFAVRELAADEAHLAIDWAAAEGWNPGLDDAALFHAADPHGFLAGQRNGEPVATISVVKYGAVGAFLGLYIVKPACRGQGFGWRLWQAGMARLAGRTVGLDGVVAQQDNYRQSGFRLAWRNIRFEGRATGVAVPADPHILPLATLPFDSVAAYDQPLFGWQRSGFLQGWIAQPQGRALGLVEDGGLRGYGVLRPCRQGCKVGPLFADTTQAAERLFAALAAGLPAGTPVYLDCPEPNAGALALAQRHGMRLVFETARMYRGDAPALPLERIFGITTFELG